MDLCFEEISVRKSHDYRDVGILEKLRFQNVFAFHTKTKSGSSQIPLFSWRISVDSRLNCRNKDAFSNFCGVLWTMPRWPGSTVLTKSINIVHDHWKGLFPSCISKKKRSFLLLPSTSERKLGGKDRRNKSLEFTKWKSKLTIC